MLSNMVTETHGSVFLPKNSHAAHLAYTKSFQPC